MGLIKSENTPSSMVPFSMMDVERHAKNLILRAQQRAEQLLAAAQAEAQSLKTEAYTAGKIDGRREGTAEGLTQGRQAGHQQALTEFKAQFTQASAAFNAAATMLDQSRNQMEGEALVEVVKLALSIARRITKRQAVLDPQVLIENLREAMKLVIKSADIRIAIHPSQRKLLNETLPALQLQWPTLAHVTVIEDAALQPGGCRVFTETGQIDATVETQLDRIAAELLPTPPAQDAA
jgi:flagellar assembly protein FliH